MKNKKYILIPLTALILIGGACAKKTATNTSNTNHALLPCQTETQTDCDHSLSTATSNTNANANLSDADLAGLMMSNQKCIGSDKPKFTHLPMDPKDVAFILPYGLMVGGHVTPVDHQYFSPIVFNSKTSTYNVYAMADSHLVDVQTRQHNGQGLNAGTTVTDYRLVFYVSCHLLYYYDLINSLEPGLEQEWKNSGDVAVQSGQLIGHIGGQTLDFAVWDTDVTLPGLLVKSHYDRESWKQYTADPLNYYADDVKAQALGLYIRTAEPISGKIDYDVDGKLIGTWFKKEADGTTTGYAGTGQSDYWTTHLSISPYFLDPTGFLISIGNWPDGAAQFATKEGGPNPATVDVSTGLVKYTLVEFRDYLANGQAWDDMTHPSSAITLHPTATIKGCFLVQMTASREIKAEALKGKTCTQVSGFTTAAVSYIR